MGFSLKLPKAAVQAAVFFGRSPTCPMVLYEKAGEGTDPKGAFFLHSSILKMKILKLKITQQTLKRNIIFYPFSIFWVASKCEFSRVYLKKIDDCQAISWDVGKAHPLKKRLLCQRKKSSKPNFGGGKNTVHLQ